MIMFVDLNTVAIAAAIVGAGYLIRDPRPEEQQKVLHFNK